MITLKLIQKDFRAHWVYQLAALAILFSISTVFIYVSLVGNVPLDPQILIYFIVMLMSTGIESLLFMKMDEANKTDAFYLSLPLSRKELVIAKYGSSYIQVLLGLLAHFLGTRFAIFIYGNTDVADLHILQDPLLWLLFGSLIFLSKSYAYPLYFKFGLSLGVGIHTIIQFLLLILLIVSINVYNIQIFFMMFLEWVSIQNITLVIASIIIGLITISGVSVFLSSKIFNNKEL